MQITHNIQWWTVSLILSNHWSELLEPYFTGLMKTFLKNNSEKQDLLVSSDEKFKVKLHNIEIESNNWPQV